MTKIKIVHIHSDPKFVLDIDEMFTNPLLDNSLIYVGNESYNPEEYKYNVVQFMPVKENIEHIVSFLKGADVVVINYLDEYKSQVVHKIPENVTIIWRFFGIEFYARKQKMFLSEQTKELIKEDYNFIKSIKILKNKIYNKNDVSFFKAVKRINYITSFCEEEYELLKTHWRIPKLLKLSVDYDIFTNKKISHDKEPKLVLGNNRHSFNNHIDLIAVANKFKDQNIDFLMFFSYGGDLYYGNKIRYLSSENSKIQLIENFLDKKQFEDIYINASAFVHNGYRQMALGNIFMAIGYGLKIYLNDNNVIFKWLSREGFLISSIADLEKDLEGNNFRLTKKQIEFNIEMYNRLISNYNVQNFHEHIILIAESNK